MMPGHTDKNFEEELTRLKNSILKMGGLVEAMITRAMNSLVKRDSNLAREVIAQDNEVNQLEMEIDDSCLKILALHQPTAVDLRFVAVGLKISTDLERMGDLAVNISEQALELNKEPPLKEYIDLPKMAAKSEEMVRRALDAFVDRDPENAKKILQEDDVVDNYGDQLFDELLEIMQQRPDAVQRGMRLIIVSRQLERIADHATNIAEEVNFMVRGEDIRHRGS